MTLLFKQIGYRRIMKIPLKCRKKITKLILNCKSPNKMTRFGFINAFNGFKAYLVINLIGRKK